MRSSLAWISVAVWFLLVLSAPSLAMAPHSVQSPSSSLAPLQATETAIEYANSTDPAAVPNTGVEINLTVPTLPARSAGSTATFALSAGEVVGNDLFILGILANSSTPGQVTPGVVVVDNATDAVLGEGFASSEASGASLTFQAFVLSGTTWVFHVNGQPFSGLASYNLGAATATWTGGIGVGSSAQWAGTVWAPANITVPQALMVQKSGSWYLPHPVVTRWAGTQTPPWGMIGDAQSAALAPGELALGTDVPLRANGTALWTTAAATRASVEVTLDPTSCSGGGSVAMDAQVSAGGLPLAGQVVAFSSSGGGTFESAPLTSSTGWSNTTFTAPQEGVTTILNLTAVISNPSYTGQGTAPLTVQGTLPSSGTVTVTATPTKLSAGSKAFLAVDVTSAGVPLAGITLDVAASPGGGVFVPSAPWTTDSAGWAYGNFTTPTAGSTVTVWVNISTSGMHGSGSAALSLTGGTTVGGGGSSTNEDLEVAVVFVVIVVIALVYLATTRRRKPATDEDEEIASEAVASPPEEKPAKAAPVKPVAAPAAKSKAPEKPASAPSTCPACGAAVKDPNEKFCPSCGLPVRSTRKLADD